MNTFYLGTHQVNWLSRAGVPLFISRRRLMHRKRLPRAVTRWALDSGGFTEISLHGHWWNVQARAYAKFVRRCVDEIGMLDFAAPQDWMCEPQMLARTGLTVQAHQRLTINNYLELKAIDATLPICPVLQGWCAGDYFDHAEQYARAGVDLASLPVVGVGTVCRRQGMTRAGWLLGTLRETYGLRNLHGFGFKTQGLQAFGQYLQSADSLAWSFDARHNEPLPGCRHGADGTSRCTNCVRYALAWREQLLAGLGADQLAAAA